VPSSFSSLLALNVEHRVHCSLTPHSESLIAAAAAAAAIDRHQKKNRHELPDQGRRAPELVDVDDLLGNVDEALVGDLLPDQLVGEERGEIAGIQRLVCLRVQWWRRLHRQVGDEVVPLLRDAHLGARIRAGPSGESQASPAGTGRNSVLRCAQQGSSVLWPCCCVRMYVIRSVFALSSTKMNKI